LQFISVYYDNIGKQNVEAVKNSALGQAIVKLINKEPLRSWQGPLSKLLDELNEIAEDKENNIDTSKAWPRAPNSLSRRLKPLLSNLREGLGINISITRNTAGNRKVRRYVCHTSITSDTTSKARLGPKHRHPRPRSFANTFTIFTRRKSSTK
jgi:hypothetical protein